MTGFDIACPTCGAPIPQSGGDFDADLVMAHDIAYHSDSEQPAARRDLTYRDAIAILAALVLAVMIITQVIQ